MEPVKLGRTLGIGMRVASGILRDRASRVGQPKAAVPSPAPAEPASSGSSAPAGPTLAEQPTAPPPARAAAPATARVAMRPPVAEPRVRVISRSAEFGRIAGQTLRASRQVPGRARTAVRGIKGFGKAFWGPFRHASGLLWMEITGMFFALFGLFFAQNAYNARSAWLRGTEHDHFILYIALTVIFFWFAVSSFMRAHKRSKRGRR